MQFNNKVPIERPWCLGSITEKIKRGRSTRHRLCIPNLQTLNPQTLEFHTVEHQHETANGTLYPWLYGWVSVKKQLHYKIVYRLRRYLFLYTQFCLFTIGKKWKHSKCPLTDEWIMEIWYSLKYNWIIFCCKGRWNPVMHPLPPSSGGGYIITYCHILSNKKPSTGEVHCSLREIYMLSQTIKGIGIVLGCLPEFDSEILLLKTHTLWSVNLEISSWYCPGSLLPDS